MPIQIVRIDMLFNGHVMPHGNRVRFPNTVLLDYA